MISPGIPARRSSSADTTAKAASLKTTAGRVGDRRKRRSTASRCAESSGTTSATVRNAARSESTEGVSNDTV